MKNHLLLLFLCCSVAGFSQNSSLKVLQGVLVCDSLKVERATITNATSNTYSISDDLGFFSIFAKEGDTLVISSVAFDTERLILKASDFKQLICTIHLSLNVNQLDEVKVGPYKLSGDLVYDAKRIKVKPSFQVDLPKLDIKNMEITGVKARVENLAMSNVDKSLNGADFIKLGGALISLLGGSPSEKTPLKTAKQYTSTEFSVEMKKRFLPEFYEKKLKVQEDEIGLFLEYCFSEEINQKLLLEKENGLALIDFLVEKSIAFHKE